MKKQRIFSVLATVVLTLSVAGSAFAAPYSSTYTGTIGTENSSIHFPEVNEGESYSVTLVFDNGGSTAANQTWNETHLTCIFFNVNDAGDVTYAQDLTVATIDQSSGLIVTDAGGVLTSMFDRVIDDTVAPGTYEASGIALQDSLAWYLNSFNDVFFSDVENTGYDLAFGDVTGGVQMGTSYWTNPQPFTGSCLSAATPVYTPVPATSSWSLVLLTGLLLMAGLIRTRRRV